MSQAGVVLRNAGGKMGENWERRDKKKLLREKAKNVEMCPFMPTLIHTSFLFLCAHLYTVQQQQLLDVQNRRYEKFSASF